MIDPFDLIPWECLIWIHLGPNIIPLF